MKTLYGEAFQTIDTFNPWFEKIELDRITKTQFPHPILLVSSRKTATVDSIINSLEKHGTAVQYSSLKQALKNPPTHLSGVILLASDKTNNLPFLWDSIDLFKKTYGALEDGNNQGQAIFATVTQFGGKFAIDGGEGLERYLNGGLAGLSKTSRYEHDKIVSKTIDLPLDLNDKVLSSLATAIHSQVSGEIAIGKAGNASQVFIQKNQGNPLTRVESFDALSKEDVVLVTGGAKGVTFAVAKELARTYQPTMVLVGRSPEPKPEQPWLQGLSEEKDIKAAILKNWPEKITPREIGNIYWQLKSAREIRTNLEAISATGAKAIYLSMDMQNREGVASKIDELEKSHGSITGVIHGAGVLQDRFIADKTREQFDKVLSTKIDGIEAILAKLNVSHLKTLILFSSSTARFGRKGQVDYAVANESLNKLGQYIKSQNPNCQVLSPNWGPWEGGMVTPELAKLFKAEGITLIPKLGGASFVIAQLENPNAAVETVVLGPDPQIPEIKEPLSVPTVKEVTHTIADWQKTISLNRNPILKDHVVGGKAVIPAAIFTEWLSEIALATDKGYVFHGVKNFKVLKGVKLDLDEEIKLFAELKEVKRNNWSKEIEVIIFSKISEEKTLAHARATIFLCDLLPKASKPSLKDISMMDKDLEPNYYDTLLFHGEELRGIESINGISDEGISAVVKTNTSTQLWDRNSSSLHFLSDPLVLDCVFQLAIVWTQKYMGAPCLPTAFGTYSQYRHTFPKDRCQVNLKVTEKKKSKILCDIELIDKQGKLLARMENYEAIVSKTLAKSFQQNIITDELSAGTQRV